MNILNIEIYIVRSRVDETPECVFSTALQGL